MIFHQLFEEETSTYTYLLGDPSSREAVLIDPVSEMIERDMKLISDLGLKLVYILETHIHADHITSSGKIREKTGAKIAISSAYDMSCSDLALKDGQILHFGAYTLTAISTPGHTKGCMSYKIEDMLFTGDTLLIRGCGRTDFQDGSSAQLFESVRNKLFSYPDETLIYPGHDYKGLKQTTVGEEKRLNPRLQLNIDLDTFTKIMADLKLSFPKKIQESVPANLLCGLPPHLT